MCIPINWASIWTRPASTRSTSSTATASSLTSVIIIGLHSIAQLEAPFIHPIDGGAHCKCKFTLIVFAPFEGEIVEGTVKSCDSSGLLISLGFFDWIIVPAVEMQSPKVCVFDAAEQLWLWKYEGHELYVDLNTQIRIKVTKIEFAKGEKAKISTGTEQPATNPNIVNTSIALCKPAMKVTGSITDDGLGLLAWWD